ncbi:MAG: hypothetical protein WBF04_19055 [Candidatus Sulfotelmatobacter sp.]
MFPGRKLFIAALFSSLLKWRSLILTTSRATFKLRTCTREAVTERRTPLLENPYLYAKLGRVEIFLAHVIVSPVSGPERTYFACRWYAALKAKRSDWWLQYL